MLEEIVLAMAEFDPDRHRINHFMKVFGYAATIGRLEGLDGETQRTLDIAAILHDIGIPASLKKYGSDAGPHQETEGPPLARALLKNFPLPEETVSRVCRLIGCHHTTDPVLGIDHRILLEADLLVNLDEGRCSSEAVAHARRDVFQTGAGLRLLAALYPEA